MPLFNCMNCGVVENTALCGYWYIQATNIETLFKPEDLEKLKPELRSGKGIRLCSECTPTHYNDGSVTDYGEWHNQFDKSYEKLKPEDY